MNRDKKTFWKYFFYEYMHPKTFVKAMGFYQLLITLVFFYGFLFLTFTLRGKAYFIIFYLLATAILEFRSLYKSGIHRRWDANRTGIPTKTELRKKLNNGGLR